MATDIKGKKLLILGANPETANLGNGCYHHCNGL